MLKHKVFISYHHDDQNYKDMLSKFGQDNDIFIDMSVDINDIDDTGKTAERIRQIIRDDYLKDSSITIILVGQNTKNRKHVDWEIYSSMHDGIANKKSGILVINLPTISQSMRVANHEEKNLLPSDIIWKIVSTPQEFESLYSYTPDRLVDNFKKLVPIAVIAWDQIKSDNLKIFLENAFNNRLTNDYDLTRSMMEYNQNKITFF